MLLNSIAFKINQMKDNIRLKRLKFQKQRQKNETTRIKKIKNWEIREKKRKICSFFIQSVVCLMSIYYGQASFIGSSLWLQPDQEIVDNATINSNSTSNGNDSRQRRVLYRYRTPAFIFQTAITLTGHAAVIRDAGCERQSCCAPTTFNRLPPPTVLSLLMYHRLHCEMDFDRNNRLVLPTVIFCAK